MKDPYVYENTNILINRANIKDQKLLADFETTLSRIAIVRMLKISFEISSTKDIFIIHEKLFNEVYEWAGKPRTINIYKEEPVLNGLSVNYSNYNMIIKDLEKIQTDIDKCNISKLSKKEKIHNLAIFISRIWQVHAFREGNTRTVCVFLYFLMRKYGLKLNTDFIGNHSKYFRNALVLASIDEYSEYEHLEEILCDATSIKIAINGETKYKTIKDYDLEKYEYSNHHIKK